MTDKDRERLKDIAGDGEGWYRRGGREQYLRLYDALVREHGVPHKEAADILIKAYWAVAEEFGA